MEVVGQRKKKKRKSLQLTDKKHPASAIVALGFGILSLGIFAAVCLASSGSNGHAGLYAGAVGLLCFFLSIVGFVISWMSLRKDNIRPLFPTLASLLNGILLVFYLFLYILGTFL